MTEPAALSVARNRAAIMEELRRLLPGAQRLRTALPFGLAAIDSHLPQAALTVSALHEVVPDGESAIPSALGFIAAVLARIMHNDAAHSADARASLRDPPPYPPPQGGRIFLIMPAYGFRQYGRLHGHGLRMLGLDPDRLIVVETANRRETLWAMEEALHSHAPAAVVGIIDKLDLKLSQRLQLAAVAAGLPLFVLRPAALLESSAAATRWRVGTMKAARDGFGLITRARWRLMLERCRNGRAGEWTVEYDHVAYRFNLAVTLADLAGTRGADNTILEHAG